MKNQKIKNIYFMLNKWIVLPNTLYTLLRYTRPNYVEGHYLHLGSGENYINGMLNIDGNFIQKKDIWLDLQNKLPFLSESFFLYIAIMYWSTFIQMRQFRC